jgi:hypothetical protein
MSTTTDLAPHLTECTERNVHLVSQKPWTHENPYLLGHCAIAVAGGGTVHDVPVFKARDDTLGVGVPGAAQIDADGRARLRDGKRQYTAILSFVSGAGRERWQRAVLSAHAATGIVP